jgi:hypothetical protein
VLARQEEEFKEINQDVDFFKKLQFQSLGERALKNGIVLLSLATNLEAVTGIV